MVVFRNWGERVKGNGVKGYKLSAVRCIKSENLIDNIVTLVEYCTV